MVEIEVEKPVIVERVVVQEKLVEVEVVRYVEVPVEVERIVYLPAPSEQAVIDICEKDPEEKTLAKASSNSNLQIYNF